MTLREDARKRRLDATPEPADDSVAAPSRRPIFVVQLHHASSRHYDQKHNNRALGPHVHAIALRQKSGSEDSLYIDDLAGLLELVQMNTLELHPWGATVDDPEHPDRLVFDLDPGEGVRWTRIKAAARAIRTRLRETGLESFVRLSGGKGVHVVVPIVPDADWEQARDFCEAFAQALAASAPERYVATMSKAKRNGVIFVDRLRNGRGNTSVCSWSLRARTPPWRCRCAGRSWRGSPRRRRSRWPRHCAAPRACANIRGRKCRRCSSGCPGAEPAAAECGSAVAFSGLGDAWRLDPAAGARSASSPPAAPFRPGSAGSPRGLVGRGQRIHEGAAGQHRVGDRRQRARWTARGRTGARDLGDAGAVGAEAHRIVRIVGVEDASASPHQTNGSSRQLCAAYSGYSRGNAWVSAASSTRMRRRNAQITGSTIASSASTSPRPIASP
ncbi:hypothetical protein Y886_30270 [Xanthomonas hyacinthi DSM 19077]|nr:hypothetical protein Y886_30270 [Xanthomonas hyacinthi DSM 19077]